MRCSGTALHPGGSLPQSLWALGSQRRSVMAAALQLSLQPTGFSPGPAVAGPAGVRAPFPSTWCPTPPPCLVLSPRPSGPGPRGPGRNAGALPWWPSCVPSAEGRGRPSSGPPESSTKGRGPPEGGGVDGQSFCVCRRPRLLPVPRGGPLPTARSLRVRPSAARGPPHGPRPRAAAVRACAVPGSSGMTACLIAPPDRRPNPTSPRARRVRWPAAGAKVTRCDLRAIAPSAGVLAVWPGFSVRFRP